MINAIRNMAHVVKCRPRTSDVAFDDEITFESLCLNSLVLKGLREAGFEKPSPIQLKSIPLGKCGFDLVVQAKSGTGKTCVFAVLILDNLVIENDFLKALVMAPTREIAVQISDVIIKIGKYIPGLKCHTFIGGMSVEEDKKHLKKCHIAIATPGRMRHLMDQEQTLFEHVRFLVLDEADRLLDSNFQDDIVWIYKHLPEKKQMITLSATYPESLARHITKFMESAVVVRLNSDDPALLGVMQYYKCVPFSYNQHQVYLSKFSELLKVLNAVDYKQCLIFSNYQIRSESLQNDLNREKFPTAIIAGNMEQQDRLAAISKLKNFQCRILVSTDLTCRGIDAEFVDLVINFDVPNCYETYLHRIGRGGRFGSYSAAITLVAEGNEFDALAKIEQLSNTCIAQLPDPMPSDITHNPRILRESLIQSISSSRVTMHAPDEITICHSSINSLSNEFKMLYEDLQNNDKGKEDNLQYIDYNALASTLFGGFAQTVGSRISTSHLLGEYNSFSRMSDRDFHKIKSAIEATEDLELSFCQEQEHELMPRPTLFEVINHSRTRYFKQDEAMFDLWMEHISGKCAQLEKVFNIVHKETNIAVKNSPEVVKENSISSLRLNIRYSKAQLLNIKKSMPGDCFDYSEIHCDENILKEIKRGEYLRNSFNSNKVKSNIKTENHRLSKKPEVKSDNMKVPIKKCEATLKGNQKVELPSDNVNLQPLGVQAIQQISINEQELLANNTNRDDLKKVKELSDDSCGGEGTDNSLKSTGCAIPFLDNFDILQGQTEYDLHEDVDASCEDNKQTLHTSKCVQNSEFYTGVEDCEKRSAHSIYKASCEQVAEKQETKVDYYMKEKSIVNPNSLDQYLLLSMLDRAAGQYNISSSMPGNSSTLESLEHNNEFMPLKNGSLDCNQRVSQNQSSEDTKKSKPLSSRASVTVRSTNKEVLHAKSCHGVTGNRHCTYPSGRELQLLVSRSWKIANIHAGYIDHMIKFNKKIQSHFNY